jgi:hypothetical protein
MIEQKIENYDKKKKEALPPSFPVFRLYPEFGAYAPNS